MVDNNRAIAFTFAAPQGRVLGIGNIAHKRSHTPSNDIPSGYSLGSATEYEKGLTTTRLRGGQRYLVGAGTCRS